MPYNVVLTEAAFMGIMGNLSTVSFLCVGNP